MLIAQFPKEEHEYHVSIALTISPLIYCTFWSCLLTCIALAGFSHIALPPSFVLDRPEIRNRVHRGGQYCIDKMGA